MASCNEEGCSVLTSGKCINGLAIDICTHYSLDDSNINFKTDDIKDNVEDSNDDLESNETESYHNDVIDTHSGKALTLDEANNISKSVLTKLIILAGMPNAGKTTLLLTLMHLFTNKPSYEGYIFAGSETLIDFEEKSHPSKIDSQEEVPDTGRTPFGPPTFLHLKFANQNKNNDIVDMLFTDISGETFKALKDSTDECKKFKLALRADHFVLFFDTKMLTTLSERAISKTSGMGILRGLIEAGTILPKTNIQIVFSRWDLFNEKENRENNEKFIKLLKEHILKQYGSIFKIDFFEVSCRSEKQQIDLGHGLNKIFALWIKKNNQQIINNNPRFIETNRQFMKFQSKN